ncbi:MAG: excinuclease ABC subunit UvrA, partial [Spirochaetales bacterium]|nr:excinuclease ABC subunit UvrA [Spirochaetales bacterium]
MDNQIVIRGAREHNLKNIDITLPRDKMIVVSGVSGSGKSSLAFDTIYAEGQRRYVESLSSYARMFLGQMEKPDLDYIGGLSPAIAIEQKTTARNPRSTVATVTEIYDYLRLLFARIGKPFCYKCGKPIEGQTVDQIIDKIMTRPEGTKLMIMAPVARNKKGEFQNVFADAVKAGYNRVIVDGEMHSLEEKITLEKNIRHTILIVVDRIKIKSDIHKRLADSIETAIGITGGLIAVDFDGEIEYFSDKFACTDCGISYPEIQPRIFSFNNPLGACETCHGIGETSEFSLNKIIPNKKLSLSEGAILTHQPKQATYFHSIIAVSHHFGLSIDTPFEEL